jgi:hypothetical protein
MTKLLGKNPGNCLKSRLTTGKNRAALLLVLSPSFTNPALANIWLKLGNFKEYFVRVY